MYAGPQSHLAGQCLAGIGQETSGRDHFAFLQPIEPVPEKQTGDYNTTITTSAAKTGRDAQERTEKQRRDTDRQQDKNRINTTLYRQGQEESQEEKTQCSSETG